MKIEIKGPLAIFSEIGRDPNYKAIVNCARIVDDNGCLSIAISEEDATRHWIELVVFKKPDPEKGIAPGTKRNIKIFCKDHAEAEAVATALVNHNNECKNFRKQGENT